MNETFEQRVLRIAEEVAFRDRKTRNPEIDFARALAAEWFKEVKSFVTIDDELTPLYRKPEGLK